MTPTRADEPCSSVSAKKLGSRSRQYETGPLIGQARESSRSARSSRGPASRTSPCMPVPHELEKIAVEASMVVPAELHAAADDVEPFSRGERRGNFVDLVGMRHVEHLVIGKMRERRSVPA